MATPLLKHPRFAHLHVDRPLRGGKFRQQQLDLACALGGKPMKQRHMRRHEIALWRVVLATKRIEGGKGFAVHLKRQHERRRRAPQLTG